MNTVKFPGDPAKNVSNLPLIFGVRRVGVLRAFRENIRPIVGNTVGKYALSRYLSGVSNRVRMNGKYRRRRLVAATFLAAAMLSVYHVAGAGAKAEPSLYTVQPGDTIWSLASERASLAEDVRVGVEEIRDANDLSGYEIHSGQVLRLPA